MGKFKRSKSKKRKAKGVLISGEEYFFMSFAMIDSAMLKDPIHDQIMLAEIGTSTLGQKIY